MGELVGVAHHEALEGVVLRAGEEPLGLGLLPGVPLLLLPADDHRLQVGGEEVVERLFDIRQIPVLDHVPLEGDGDA